MAYVPDGVMRRKRELSHSAGDVYEQLCGFGDPNTGIVKASYATNPRLVKWTGLKLGTVKNARTELRKKGWIEERGGYIFLRVGTFLNELRKRKKEGRAPAPVTDDQPFISDASSFANDQPSPMNDASSLMGDGAYKGSRARSYQPTNQPEDQHTHTSPLAPPGDQPSQGDGVCVPIRRTKHADEPLKAYAAAKGLGGGWLTTARRTGEWDADVDDFLESLRPEAVVEARAATPETGLFFSEAAQYVESFIRAGHDPAQAIGYVNVSEDVRARLIEKFRDAAAKEVATA